MKKMGSFVQYLCFLPELWSLNCLKRCISCNFVLTSARNLNLWKQFTHMHLKVLGQPSPPGQFSSRTITPGQFPSRTITPGQFPPRTIAPWKILPDNSHLGVLYCTRIIKTRQLLPRAMTITSYNFFMTIFCFFAMAQL